MLIAFVAAYSVGAFGRNLPYAMAVLGGFAVTTGSATSRRSRADMLWTCLALCLPLAVGLTARRLRGQTQAAEHRAQVVQQDQQALAAAAAAEERRRIARELHDIVSHSLGVVVLHAGAAEQVLDRDPDKAREALRSDTHGRAGGDCGDGNPGRADPRRRRAAA